MENSKAKEGKAAKAAKNLVKKMASDKSFRASLEGATTKEARLAILARNGFGDVSLSQARAVVKAEGMDVTDEQLLAVASGLNVTRPVEWAKVVVAAAALFV